MLQKLFHREPEYDENGKIIGYKLPPIVWIIIVGVFIHRVSKSGGQKGGAKHLAFLRSTNTRAWLKKWAWVFTMVVAIFFLGGGGLFSVAGKGDTAGDFYMLGLVFSFVAFIFWGLSGGMEYTPL